MLISQNWAICAITFTDNIINTILYILYYKLCDSETIPLLLYKHISYMVCIRGDCSKTTREAALLLCTDVAT